MDFLPFDEKELQLPIAEVGEDIRWSEGKVSPHNQLNDLTGRQWIRFTRSWFIHNPPSRTTSEIVHPGKFPETMVREFIEFFTKMGEIVLDPFMGVGSTLLASSQCSRRGIGIEVNSKYTELAREHLGLFVSDHVLINDDAARIPEIWKERDLPEIDFVFTSPPYWDMLSKSRGNVQSVHKDRIARGLDYVYSTDDPRDLGIIADYDLFLESLVKIFDSIYSILKLGKYMVVVVQNLRNPEGRIVTLAWDLARDLQRLYTFKGERIWCQDNKRLGIWGYPKDIVLNVHHHYCLIFKKEKQRSSKPHSPEP